jgi:hypothetical protein
VQQDRAEREYWAGQPPVACPNDGTPLVEGQHGELHCSHDGYTWPQDRAAPGEAGG